MTFAAVLLFALGACAPRTPASAGGAAATSLASANELPAAACAIQQPHGPGDAPPAGGETNSADQGPGRWCLRLQSPTGASVEGSAWCTWNPERTRVVDVSGLPTPAGGVEYDTFLLFDGMRLEVHLSDRAHGGLIANYEPRQPVVPTTDTSHKVGTVAFDDALQVDPESGPPPGAPPTVAGAMAWMCGDPPPAG